jgi:GAF domain-containing protein
MATNEQVIVDDVLTSKIFVGQPAQKVLLEAEVRAIISMPLRTSKGNLLGVISTHFSRPGHPSERQLRLANILARQAADYLERKHSAQIQQTIVLEVQHRSNNLLTVIQSIAQRRLAGDQSKKTFEARLQALGRAKRQSWRSASASSLAGCEGRSDRCSLKWAAPAWADRCQRGESAGDVAQIVTFATSWSSSTPRGAAGISPQCSKSRPPRKPSAAALPGGAGTLRVSRGILVVIAGPTEADLLQLDLIRGETLWVLDKAASRTLMLVWRRCFYVPSRSRSGAR